MEFLCREEIREECELYFLVAKEYGNDGGNKIWNQTNSHGFHVIYIFIYIYTQFTTSSDYFFLFYAALGFFSPLFRTFKF